MRHFSRSRITGKTDDLWGCGHCCTGVANSSEVNNADGLWLTAEDSEWPAISVASAKERGSEEAIFPARGQKATSENDVTRTDGAGSLYVHAARCAGQTYKTPAAHTVHTLKLYLHWAYIGGGDISEVKGKQLFIYVALAIGWIGYDHQKSCWDLGMWSQK